MHGPEHHVMVGAVLLTAYKNAEGDLELHPALAEMMNREKVCRAGSADSGAPAESESVQACWCRLFESHCRWLLNLLARLT